MSKKTTRPDLTPEQKLDWRRSDAMMRLQLLTRLCRDAASNAEPHSSGFAQWELIVLFELQDELLDELEAVESGRIELDNARILAERSSKQAVQ